MNTSTWPSKGKTIGLWILTSLLAAGLTGAGGTKLLALPPHPEAFAGWGLPPWCMYVTGVIEVSTAILLVVPRTSFVGAVFTIFTMIGAILTHLFLGDPTHVTHALPFLLVSSVLAYVRRDTLLKLVGYKRTV